MSLTRRSADDFSGMDTRTLKELIGTCPEPVLIGIAREAARTQDLRVLGIMTEAGCFEFDPQKIESNRRRGWFADDEYPLVAAWANVLDGAEPMVFHEGPFRENFEADKPFKDGIRSARRLKVSDPFKEAFRAVAEEFVSAHMAHGRAIAGTGGVGSSSHRVNQSACSTMAALGAAACAMNDAKSAGILAHGLWALSMVDPVAGDVVRLRPTILGFAPDQTMARSVASNPSSSQVDCTVRLSPWCLAHEFEAPDALNAIRNVLPDFDPLANSVDLWLSKDHQSKVRLGTPILWSQGWMGSSPANWRRALEGDRSEALEAEDRGCLALMFSAALRPSSKAEWLEAALDSRMHTFDMRQSLGSIFSQGRGDVLDRVRTDFPWGDDAQHGHVFFALAARARLRNKGCPPLMSTVVKWAIEEGRWDALMAARKPERNQLGAPKQSIIESMAHHGLVEPVLLMLEHGYDPRSLNDKGQNLADAIYVRTDKPNPSKQFLARQEIIGIARSWAARLSAQEAIADFQVCPRAKPSEISP